MSEIFYEDIEIDKRYKSTAYELTQAAMIDFACEWDPQPYHTDAQLAAEYPLKKLFASGVHLLAICCKLANESAPQTQALAGLGWDTLRFKAPAYAGDKLRCENWAIEKRLSKSQKNAGIVTYQLRLINQDDLELLTYTVTCLMQCRNTIQQPSSQQ